jgi:glycosyltransferase involved in cell wall biosynthesis
LKDALDQKRYKVLHIITRMIRSGGAEKNTLQTIKYIENDFDVDLLIGGESEPAAVAAVSLRTGNLEILLRLNNRINIISDFICLWQLIRIMKKGKYDIVHTHEAKANLIGRTAAIFAGVPVIICGLHANTFAHPKLSSSLLKQALLLTHRFLALYTTHFVSVGYQLKNDFIRLGIGDYYKHSVLRSGFDLSKFREAKISKKDNRKRLASELGFSEDALVVGLVSTFEPRKGHLKAIEVAQKVIAMMGDSLVIFLFVGDGGFIPEIQDAISNKNLGQFILLTGYRSDIHQVMSTFDVQIHTSTQEGLPQVIVQGIALGIPLVVFDTEGIAELIRNEQIGFVLPKGDIEGMASQVACLLKKHLETIPFDNPASSEDSCMEWDIPNVCKETREFYFSIRDALSEIEHGKQKVSHRSFQKYIKKVQINKKASPGFPNGKVRILHLTQSLGGVETALRSIVENIDDKNFESHVAVPEPLKIWSKSGVPIKVHHIRYLRNIHPIKDLACLICTLLLIRKLKPSLVHCYSSKAGIIGRLAGKLLGVPTIFTPQGLSILSSDKKFIRQLFLAIERLAGHWTTLFLSCSESEWQHAIQNFRIPPERCKIWKNNLPRTRFENIQIAQQYNFKYICSIGRPSFQKNIEMLVNVVARLKQCGNKIKCILMGVGHYSPLKQKVENMVLNLGLSESFLMLEWIDNANALSILSGAELLVLTSRYEGLPYSVIEAMALGKAVVATNVEGTRDIVKTGITGELMELGDVEAMATTIVSLINDPLKKEKYEANAREEYLTFYDTLKQIQELENIYKSQCSVSNCKSISEQENVK